MKHLLAIALACATASAHSQTSQPTPSQPPAPLSAQTTPPAGDSRNTSESSRVSRLLSGPDGRPQGFLLRNGTFVTLSPGLAQQMPTTLRRNATVQVRGLEYASNGERTIQAQELLLAGISYRDVMAAPLSPGSPGMRAAAVPPPPPGGAPGSMPPPSLPPCGIAAAPPPPPAPNRSLPNPLAGVTPRTPAQQGAAVPAAPAPGDVPPPPIQPAAPMGNPQ